MRMKDKFCPFCGEKFVYQYKAQMYCSDECKKNAALVRAKDRRERAGVKKVVKRGKESLSEINRRAREHGLTYGQYVVLMADNRRNVK